MKNYILMLLLLISVGVTAQIQLNPIEDRKVFLGENKVFWKKKIKQYSIQGGLILIGGAADGLNERLYAHYSGFQAQFPNANPQYWNPAISWENKWKWDDTGIKDSNHIIGEKFLGSSSVFVSTTDAYHLLRTIDRTTMMIALSINLHQKQKWYWYLVDIAAMSIFRSAGFHITYR